MKSSLVVKLAISFAVVFALLSVQPAARAKESEKSIEKQAHKIHNTLTRYPAGSLLHLTMRDGTEATGKLGTLSDESFAFVNADSNARETLPYRDVTKVEKGKEYIGAGSAPHHHIF